MQSAWDSHFDGGKATLNSINRLLTAAEPVWLAEVVVALVLLAYLVLFVVSCVQRQPPVLIVYSAMILLIALGDAAYFNSRARFLLPAVALLLPVATALARVRSRASLIVLLAGGTALSTWYGIYTVFTYTNSP